MRVPSAPVPVWLVFGAGVLLAAAGARSRGPIRFSTGLLSVVLALAVMAIVDFSPSPPRDPKLTFLDVGQGDSTLVELPDGQRFLIDAGGVPSGTSDSGGGFRVGEEVVSQYLFSRRIRRIDTVVLTHAHHDHMDGIMDVVENFQVGEVWLGTNPMLPGYRALLEAIYAQRIPLRHVRTGDAAGPFEVLNPPPNRAAAAEVRNDDSVVLLLRWGEQTALLPGDLEGQLSGVPAMTDVLKIPHHGSPNTRLRTTAPVRVISVGAHNRFGHPGANRLPALRTDLLGTIEVTLAPGGPRIEFPGLR